MTSTIIIPQEPRVHLYVPPSYVGRQVEVTFTLIDEPAKPQPAVKLSELFRGVFSKEDAESFNQHIKTMREEWDDI